MGLYQRSIASLCIAFVIGMLIAWGSARSDDEMRESPSPNGSPAAVSNAPPVSAQPEEQLYVFDGLNAGDIRPEADPQDPRTAAFGARYRLDAVTAAVQEVRRYHIILLDGVHKEVRGDDVIITFAHSDRPEISLYRHPTRPPQDFTRIFNSDRHIWPRFHVAVVDVSLSDDRTTKRITLRATFSLRQEPDGSPGPSLPRIVSSRTIELRAADGKHVTTFEHQPSEYGSSQKK